MTTTNQFLFTNKRKFISDDQQQSHKTTFQFNNTNQDELNSNIKKTKFFHTGRVSLTSIDIKSHDDDDDDEKMICENSDKIDDKKPEQPNVIVPKHSNAICNADASPTTLRIRCYCDPLRLGSIVPYDSDIY